MDGENEMVKRLREGREATIEDLFRESQYVVCICGHKMTTYDEYLLHQKNAKGYYDSILRRTG